MFCRCASEFTLSIKSSQMEVTCNFFFFQKLCVFIFIFFFFQKNIIKNILTILKMQEHSLPKVFAENETAVAQHVARIAYWS